MGYRREDTKKNKDEQKRRIKNRYNVTIDESNYRFFPAKKQLDYYDNDVPQRVAVYARVSTDNVAQTTSYELQRKYYEEFVTRHPNWTLVHIYADEGISGTSMTAGFRLIVITLFSIQFGYNGAPIVINLDFYHFVYKLVFNFHCLVLSAEGS